MRYRLTPKLNHGRAEAPPIEIEVDDDTLRDEYGNDLGELILGELCNDYDLPYGAPFSLLIERLPDPPTAEDIAYEKAQSSEAWERMGGGGL